MTMDKRTNGRKLSAMQIACVALAALIALFLLGMGGFFLCEKAMHERALRNYPAAYVNEIRSISAQYELDPYLVISIMRCESSFDPNAVSTRGAIGLMQIMPDTGEWIAHKLEMDDIYEESMLYDPETNITFGCWYLRFVKTRLNGDVMQMICAYNAGHGSVKEWLSDPRFSQNGVLTSIPFPATERYYEKVVTAYENYASLYPTLFDDEVQSGKVAWNVSGVLYCVNGGRKICLKSY